MGCVSSKLFRKELQQDLLYGNGDYPNHVVSLTSSTYGVLKLDNSHQQNDQKQQEDAMKVCVKELKRSPSREQPEIINAWELLGDLDEQIPISVNAKKSPHSRLSFVGYTENGVRRSPLKYLNQIGSPRMPKKFGGKENKTVHNAADGKVKQLDVSSPNMVLSSESSRKYFSISRGLKKFSPLASKLVHSPGNSSGCSSRRRSLTPLFDPELLEAFEKELSEEQEQVKQMVSQTPKCQKPRDAESFLESFDSICPPAGENAVITYTTTLRGIRKTFEDCSIVRSILQSHQIHMIERDLSMDSRFKEELRKLIGRKEAKIPLVFIKGRLIGGAEEVLKLEEEGKLEIFLDGIPKALASACEGCAGIRFVMCLACSGSCKVLDEVEKKMIRCDQCNENGLIQCPICS
ncbi:hypothetical protein Nepgr_011754 [Nepenthes gracilis]|uniref:Glutaredoxin domain-containing protein n=1 Tax=Nepenthes gracilis TaxID=150966 RepID=A0AAD3XM72_NEPGR|nr:hypothetical protein Nepgr_011754 [Nepenthes gracilis]